MQTPFQFKKFSVQQDNCAMKIGTDGVLLGAWAVLKDTTATILDIGTGTGVIALMLAQRCDAQQIDALEIDAAAYEQATDNFENSPWSDRLYCYHAGLDEFVEEPEDLYDVIVCNPPFFSEDVKTNNPQRDAARFQEAMPFEELLEATDLFLSDLGVFSVIIPTKEEQKFIKLAANYSLFPCKITHVKGSPSSEIKRSLLAFNRNNTNSFVTGILVIETSRHQYTDEYKQLTRDFYYKM